MWRHGRICPKRRAKGIYVVPATLPATWQNGEPIKPLPTVLVAATEDYSIKATAQITLTQ